MAVLLFRTQKKEDAQITICQVNEKHDTDSFKDYTEDEDDTFVEGELDDENNYQGNIEEYNMDDKNNEVVDLQDIESNIEEIHKQQSIRRVSNNSQNIFQQNLFQSIIFLNNFQLSSTPDQKSQNMLKEDHINEDILKDQDQNNSDQKTEGNNNQSKLKIFGLAAMDNIFMKRTEDIRKNSRYSTKISNEVKKIINTPSRSSQQNDSFSMEKRKEYMSSNSKYQSLSPFSTKRKQSPQNLIKQKSLNINPMSDEQGNLLLISTFQQDNKLGNIIQSDKFRKSTALQKQQSSLSIYENENSKFTVNKKLSAILKLQNRRQNSLITNIIQEASVKENIIKNTFINIHAEVEQDFDKAKEYEFYFYHNNLSIVIDKANKLNRKNRKYQELIRKQQTHRTYKSKINQSQFDKRSINLLHKKLPSSQKYYMSKQTLKSTLETSKIKTLMTEGDGPIELDQLIKN